MFNNEVLSLYAVLIRFSLVLFCIIGLDNTEKYFPSLHVVNTHLALILFLFVVLSITPNTPLYERVGKGVVVLLCIVFVVEAKSTKVLVFGFLYGFCVGVYYEVAAITSVVTAYVELVFVRFLSAYPRIWSQGPKLEPWGAPKTKW